MSIGVIRLFSDECSFQRRHKTLVLVFRPHNEAAGRNPLGLKNHGRDISQITERSIWHCRRSKMFIKGGGDGTARKNGYTAKPFVEIPQENLILYHELGFIFQQDNAAIYRARITQKLIEARGTRILDWP